MLTRLTSCSHLPKPPTAWLKVHQHFLRPKEQACRSPACQPSSSERNGAKETHRRRLSSGGGPKGLLGAQPTGILHQF